MEPRHAPGARHHLVSDEHDHFYSHPALMYIDVGQTRFRETEPGAPPALDTAKGEP